MNNMDIRVEQILKELFAIDPGLKEHEEQVRTVIVELLRVRPESKVDPAFAQNLRDRLLAVYPHAVTAKTQTGWGRFFAPVLAYPLAGIAVLVLVAGLLQGGGESEMPLLKGGIATRSLGAEAFGPLTLAEQNQVAQKGGGGLGGAEDSAAEPAPATMMAPQAFGRGGAPDGMGGGAVGMSVAPVPPAPVIYKYVYNGEPVDLSQTAAVYRRTPGTEGDGMSGLLQNLDLGLLNPSSFANSKVQSFNLANDDYFIFVNLTEGSININENWRGGYPEMQPLTQGDVPPDADLIAIADAFVRDHGISREGYSEPFVLKQDYGPVIMETPEKGIASPQIFIPEIQTVVYPLMLRDQTVYEEYGNATGLTVSVNIRTKKVNGVYNLFTQNYDVSEYPAETDFQRIRNILAQGGFRNYYQPEGYQTVEVEVGEPAWGMVRVWTYTDKPQELFVPALVFPIKDRPAGTYLPERIVVPVVKSILEPPPQPQPMPVDLPVPMPRPM